MSQGSAGLARVLAACLIITTLLGSAACSGDADTAERPAGSDAPTDAPTDATSGEGEWVRTLPTEPGTSWDVARYYTGDSTVPVQIPVAGPWVFDVVGDGWVTATEEIADPAEVPGLDEFGDHTFVLKGIEGTSAAYYVRKITDEWMLQLGKITDDGTSVTAEPYEQPLELWPVDIEVGDSFPVGEGESFSTVATVLAESSVTTPTGTIDRAFLVRFEYTAMAPGAPSGTQYYVLAPDVGVVATFSAVAGDEATGFTELDMATVLTRFPGR